MAPLRAPISDISQVRLPKPEVHRLPGPALAAAALPTSTATTEAAGRNHVDTNASMSLRDYICTCLHHIIHTYSIYTHSWIYIYRYRHGDRYIDIDTDADMAIGYRYRFSSHG